MVDPTTFPVNGTLLPFRTPRIMGEPGGYAVWSAKALSTSGRLSTKILGLIFPVDVVSRIEANLADTEIILIASARGWAVGTSFCHILNVNSLVIPLETFELAEEVANAVMCAGNLCYTDNMLRLVEEVKLLSRARGFEVVPSCRGSALVLAPAIRMFSSI